MNTPPTWEERYEACRRLLTQYAEAVEHMRRLQEESRHWVKYESRKPLNDAEREVDALTVLHLAAPIPAATKTK